MKARKGDYVIVNNKSQGGNKKFLMKVRESTDEDITGILEHMPHLQRFRSSITVKHKEVIALLGPNPAEGRVHGIDVAQRYQGKKTHPKVGDVHFFYDIDKAVVTDLMTAFDKVYNLLKKRGLDFLVDDIVWEILPYTGGKYAGMFIHKKIKGEDEALNRIQLHIESQPASEWPFLILHELGHHLHTNFATSKKLNAVWVRLFNTSVRVHSIKKETSQELLDSMLDGEDLPSDFKTSLDEEQALSYKWILRTIQQLNGLSVRELDLMFEADMKDDIRKLWPTRTISHKELAPVISEYSCKSYRETLAECFAFYCTVRKLPSGDKLPESVVRLMEKTISYAKTNRVETT